MKKFLVVMLSVVAITGLLVVPSFGVGEKLIVKDGLGNNSFIVYDPATVAAGIGMTQILGNSNAERFEIRSAGAVGAEAPTVQGKGFGGTIAAPTATQTGHILFNLGASGHDGTNLITGNKATILIRAGQNWTPAAHGTYMTFDTTANGSTTRTEKMRINGDGSIVFANGASISAAGVVTSNPSSRALKDHIIEMKSEEALSALEQLNPVRFSYIKDPGKTYNGFIAEEVPALVATDDRKSVNPMDVVAVLTKVVQEQNKTIGALSSKVEKLEKAVIK